MSKTSECIEDGGECGLGGYCNHCPYKIKELEQENHRLREALLEATDLIPPECIEGMCKANDDAVRLRAIAQNKE